MQTKRVRSFVLLLIIVQMAALFLAASEVSAKPRQAGQASFWSDFMRWFQPKKKLRAGKGGGCMVSPIWLGQNNVAKVWNQRPVFVWNGRESNVGLTREDDDQLFWKEQLQAAPRGNRQIQYTGSTLQPGQSYRWNLLTLTDQVTQSTSFQVIGGTERDRVTIGLKTLQAQLEAEKLSAEEKALRRAEFFVRHDLVSDAIQEVFSVKNPSPELQDLAEKMATEICTE